MYATPSRPTHLSPQALASTPLSSPRLTTSSATCHSPPYVIFSTVTTLSPELPSACNSKCSPFNPVMPPRWSRRLEMPSSGKFSSSARMPQQQTLVSNTVSSITLTMDLVLISSDPLPPSARQRLKLRYPTLPASTLGLMPSSNA